jgi:2-methylcitrate dehydratase PrpD
LAAFVAATEVMCRIGLATKTLKSHKGFHAIGTAGPFGAAAAAGRLRGFNPETMASALGIAGSFSSGLDQFEQSSETAMVKCLHFGRAAENGVLAASLAGRGLVGPHNILEGSHGFVRAFYEKQEPAELTRELGERFLTLTIYTKRYSCHGSAQIPLRALETLLSEQRIPVEDIELVDVTGPEEVVRRNNVLDLSDIIRAQFSVPFCIALAFVRNPRDPRSFDESALSDVKIRSLTSRVKYLPATDPGEVASGGSTVTITLRNGVVLQQSASSFKGIPSMPADRNDLDEKFSILTRHCSKSHMDEVFDRIQNLEDQENLDWLHA